MKEMKMKKKNCIIFETNDKKFIYNVNKYKYINCRYKRRFTKIFTLTWDQALFSFRFENYIPAGKAIPVRENVWEPLKLGLISGYIRLTL